MNLSNIRKVLVTQVKMQILVRLLKVDTLNLQYMHI